MSIARSPRSVRKRTVTQGVNIMIKLAKIVANIMQMDANVVMGFCGRWRLQSLLVTGFNLFRALGVCKLFSGGGWCGVFAF